MELSSEVSAGLKSLASCNFNEFNGIVDQIVQDLKHIDVGFECRNKGCCSQSSSYSSLLVLFTELSKRQLAVQHLIELLLDLAWPQERINVVTASFDQVTRGVRSGLASVASLLPHIVDVDWKLLHTVSGIPCTPPKESTYLVRFTVRTAPGSSLNCASLGGSSDETSVTSANDHAGLEHITLRCSLQQLIAVTDSLRRALATVNKLAGTT